MKYFALGLLFFSANVLAKDCDFEGTRGYEFKFPVYQDPDKKFDGITRGKTILKASYGDLSGLRAKITARTFEESAGKLGPQKYDYFLPMLTEDCKEYRVAVGPDGVPVDWDVPSIKDLSGRQE